MKIALVVWEDASEADAGPWVDRSTAPPAEPIVFHQVGFICSITSTEVVLTACVGEHQMGTRTRIPAGMVRQITELVSGEPIAIPKKRKRKG
jgi:hypothetical protein